MDREDLRARLAEVYFDDGCNSPDCDTCQITLDALTDRVDLLLLGLDQEDV